MSDGPGLFDPFTVRGVTFPNRVVVSPMSQYAARDGMASDWQLVHLGRFVLGGAGTVVVEATAVTPEGRRTPGDLGLWDDAQIAPLARVAAFVGDHGAVPAIQIGHAGRKASERRPWHGEGPLDDDDIERRGEHPWPTVAPSPIPYSARWHTPREMTTGEIESTGRAFADAARRAHRAGFRALEIYAGHGFLLHQFYSPIANLRGDEYGGGLEGRIRAVVETAGRVRDAWPDDLPLIVRLSCTDWVEDGWTVDESVVLARRLRDVGVDIITCTSGGIGGDRTVRFDLGHGYQVPLAERVRMGAGIACIAVGMIWDPRLADDIVRSGAADMVALARELLDDPNWPLHARAVVEGRARPYDTWPAEFGWWLHKRDRAIEKLGLRPDDA